MIGVGGQLDLEQRGELQEAAVGLDAFRTMSMRGYKLRACYGTVSLETRHFFFQVDTVSKSKTQRKWCPWDNLF